MVGRHQAKIELFVNQENDYGMDNGTPVPSPYFGCLKFSIRSLEGRTISTSKPDPNAVHRESKSR